MPRKRNVQCHTRSPELHYSTFQSTSNPWNLHHKTHYPFRLRVQVAKSPAIQTPPNIRSLLSPNKSPYTHTLASRTTAPSFFTIKTKSVREKNPRGDPYPRTYTGFIPGPPARRCKKWIPRRSKRKRPQVSISQKKEGKGERSPCIPCAPKTRKMIATSACMRERDRGRIADDGDY